MPKINKKHSQMRPATVLVSGFIAVIIIGTLLLLLPISTKEGQTTGFIEALFTATSATCVTGIALFDTYTHWSIFGQTLIIIMLQLGGIGMLTVVTLFNIALGKKMGLSFSKDLVSEHSLDGISGIKKVFVRIIIFAFSVETVGAIILMFTFVPKHGAYGVFMSFFLSITAFCNAGFDVLGIDGVPDDFYGYLSSVQVLLPLALLITIGGLGYAVWSNLLAFRRTKKLSMHTKIVLMWSGGLFLLGAIVYFVIVRTTDSMQVYTLSEQIGMSLFTSVSARTAGISVAPVIPCSDVSELFTMLLMFIGGAPASAAGGIKVTTFAIIVATVVSVIRNKEETVLFGHYVRKELVYKTLTVLSLSLVFVLVAFSLVYVNNSLPAMDVLFEVVSAFTNTGFSNGTSILVNDFSKIVLVFTMFAGRIGPVSLILSLSLKPKHLGNTVLPDSEIMVG